MTPSVPQNSPKAGYLAYQAEIDEAVARTLASGWYILGTEVAGLEEEFAAYLGVRHAVGVASGTDGLRLALRACGVGPGDLVFTVSHTAVATVAAIDMCGATPVFVDIDPVTFTMDPARLEDALARAHGQGTPNAVLPVHLYGHPADLTAIREISRRHGLRLIEDCSQSHGAAWEGRPTGAWGDIAVFSCYPTKNLGAFGDAGLVATDDPALNAQMRLLREYGWRERYVSAVPGENSRLDEMQAAILRVKLRHLDAGNSRRRAAAARYDLLLAGASVARPQVRPEATPVFHQYVVRSNRRDDLRAYLQDKDVGTLIHYPVPVHLQPAYARFAAQAALPETEAAAREVLSLPLYPEIPDADLDRTADALCAWERPGPD